MPIPIPAPMPTPKPSKIILPTLGCALLFALSGCGRPATQNSANPANVAAPANAIEETAIPEDSDATALDNGGANAAGAAETAVTDAWVGRWTGPEGLFLDIEKGRTMGSYTLTLKDNLDSQARYTGAATDGTIRFRRAGKDETIRAGTGKETGFKWLADKQDCLILVAGREGYCR